MPEIAAKLANRLKQPYSKRRIRLYDKAEKVDLLEKLRARLMEVVRGIGTDGGPLHRVYVITQNQTSYFAEIVSQLPEYLRTRISSRRLISHGTVTISFFHLDVVVKPLATLIRRLPLNSSIRNQACAQTHRWLQQANGEGPSPYFPREAGLG